MTQSGEEERAADAIKAGAYEEAAALLRPLAERDSEYALLTLGWIHETGVIGTPDKEAALSLYEHAASLGNGTACHYLGNLLLGNGRETEARLAFERGAELGNDDCKAGLARLADYEQEKRAAKALRQGAFDEALALLRPLAERDSEYALICLGCLYETGDAVAPNREAARLYFQRAAALGSAQAHFELGRFLSKEGENANARAAFQAAAELGHISSMSRLGGMLIKGRGVPVDLNAGIGWLQSAAAKGHLFAKKKLLLIERENARSWPGRLWVRIKMWKLVPPAIREVLRNPYSEKLW